MTFAAGCSGTGDGGSGDAPADPIESRLGNGARLADVLTPSCDPKAEDDVPCPEWLNPQDTDSQNCASPGTRPVFVTGVIINAVDRFDETSEGQLGNYYVQDASLDPQPFSGVTVFAPSFSPPDLRLYEGDVVDVGGVLEEFLGPSAGRFGECKTLPEIGGTMSFRYENGPRVAKTISLEDLKTYKTARPWLGMLVRLENVSLAEDARESGGRYTARLNVGGGINLADVPAVSNELFDLKNEGPALEQGTTFKSITGILTYFYGFKIAPRSRADFEP